MIKTIPKVPGFAVNTQHLKPGFCFFALQGEKQDGHNFLKIAAKKGAKTAVVDKTYQGPNFGLELIKVDNVLNTLQAWAKQTLQTTKAQIIGITGSVGKTTTKEFIATLLESKYKTEKTLANQNSQIGLPLSILNMRENIKAKNIEVVVLEMGMSLKGEMKRLSEIADVDVGVITNVELVHAENFKNKREIFLEKQAIFSENTKVKIVNFELLKYFKNQSGVLHKQKQERVSKKALSFSLKNKAADYFLEKINSKSSINIKNQTAVKDQNKRNGIAIFEKGKEIAFFTKEELFTETHLLEDFLVAFAVARQMGLTLAEIKAGVKNLKNEKMRFEKFLKNRVLFINDCYNANEKSVISALENLPKVKGKTIVVLGEMKELGKFSKGCHQRVGKKAFQCADFLICLGKESRFMVEGFQKEIEKQAAHKRKLFKIKKALEKKAFLFQNKKNLAQFLKSKMQANDLVLVKGSRSLEMEKLFDFLF